MKLSELAEQFHPLCYVLSTCWIPERKEKNGILQIEIKFQRKAVICSKDNEVKTRAKLLTFDPRLWQPNPGSQAI